MLAFALHQCLHCYNFFAPAHAQDVAVLQILPAIISPDPAVDSSKPAKKTRSVGNKMTALSGPAPGEYSNVATELMQAQHVSSTDSSNSLANGRGSSMRQGADSEASSSSSSFVSGSSTEHWSTAASSSGRGVQGGEGGLSLGLGQEGLQLTGNTPGLALTQPSQPTLKVGQLLENPDALAASCEEMKLWCTWQAH